MAVEKAQRVQRCPRYGHKVLEVLGVLAHAPLAIALESFWVAKGLIYK